MLIDSETTLNQHIETTRWVISSAQGQKTPSVLLVDGYNVLGELAQRGRGDGAELLVSDSCDLADAFAFDATARDKLELQLVGYSHSRGVKARVIAGRSLQQPSASGCKSCLHEASVVEVSDPRQCLRRASILDPKQSTMQ